MLLFSFVFGYFVSVRVKISVGGSDRYHIPDGATIVLRTVPLGAGGFRFGTFRVDDETHPDDQTPIHGWTFAGSRSTMPCA
jgi:hypothetical protein